MIVFLTITNLLTILWAAGEIHNLKTKQDEVYNDIRTLGIITEELIQLLQQFIMGMRDSQKNG